MKHNVIVATHHKTGTVWMDGVFKAIAREVGAEYIDFKSQYGRLDGTSKRPFILLNYDSDFGEYGHLLDRADVRVLHVIRDPRDVLISAMHYHKKSGESWLHEPIPGYDNATYQRRLKTLARKFDQYIFEMEHSTASTLRDMLSWRYGRANCFEARYEDLRQDVSLTYWRRISTFLGFDQKEQEISCQSFYRNSLFGGLSRLGNKHVRSGDINQWEREFTQDLGYAFLQKFPDVLETLSYENTSSWVLKLRQAESTDMVSEKIRGVVALLAKGKPLVDTPASLAELEKCLNKEAGDSGLLAANIHDNPICTVNYDAKIPGIVVVWKRHATSLQLRFVHEKLLELIAKHGAQKVLGDDTGLAIIHHRDQEWILEDWLPRAFRAGLKAAASKRPLSYFGRASTANIQSRAVELLHQGFDDLASAREWLVHCEVVRPN